VETLDRVKQYLPRADGQGVSTSERNDCAALTCLALQGWAFILECRSGPAEPWGVTPGASAMRVPACLAQVLQLEWSLDRSAWSPAPPVRGKKALAADAAVCAARRSADGTYSGFGGCASNMRGYVERSWPEGPDGSGAGTSYLYVLGMEAEPACNLLRASCGQPFGPFDNNPEDGWLLEAKYYDNFEDMTAGLLDFDPQERRQQLSDVALLSHEFGLGDAQPEGDLLHLVNRRWNAVREEYEQRPRCREPNVTGGKLKRHVRSRGRAAPSSALALTR